MNKFSVETKSAKLGFEILEDAQIVMTICNSNDLSGLSLDAKKRVNYYRSSSNRKKFSS